MAKRGGGPGGGVSGDLRVQGPSSRLPAGKIVVAEGGGVGSEDLNSAWTTTSQRLFECIASGASTLWSGRAGPSGRIGQALGHPCETQTTGTQQPVREPHSEPGGVSGRVTQFGAKIRLRADAGSGQDVPDPSTVSGVRAHGRFDCRNVGWHH